MHHWRAAWRAAARRPLFTCTAVVVLSFGIAANTALFSLVNTVLLRPLPFPHGERIVTAFETSPARDQSVSLVSPAHLEDWNTWSQVFDAVSGSTFDSVTDLSGAEPQRFAGQRVAPRYFDVFEMPPLIGRTFTPDEEQFGGPPAAVISEGLWARRYQRDPAAIGRRLLLGDVGYTIVGVMPKAFAPAAIDLWLPYAYSAGMLRQRGARFLRGVGRLKAGVTLEQARSEVRRLADRLGEQFPRTDKGWSVLLNDYHQAQTGSSSRQLSLLFGAIAALLLILCANISGLMLGQVQQRERELAIRSSLGATRPQVAGMVLREAVMLSALSAALSLPLSWYGMDILTKIFATLPRIQELHFDWRFALYTLAAAFCTAVIFGGVPAWQATRGHLGHVLAAGGRTQAGGRYRAHRALVAVQFSVTLALLAGAGLLLRSYHNLTRVDLGFRPANILTFHVAAEWREDRTQLGLLQQQLLEEFGRIQGVKAAGFANFLPASNATLRDQVTVEGRTEFGDDGKIATGTRSVGGGYLRALGVAMLAGESCPEPIRILNFERPQSGYVSRVLVNRAFVEKAGGGNLVGRHISWNRTDVGNRSEIIGIVGDVTEDSLDAAPVPYVYVCMPGGGWPDPEYVVATVGDPNRLVPSIRDAIRRLAPQRAVFGMTTIEDYLARSIDRPRVNAALLGVFALGALMSAALGLYGLVMLTVVSRTREIGVRIALGARSDQIVAQVLGEALRPILAATAGGTALALAVLPSFRSVFYGVSPSDISTFGAACVLLLSIATAAAFLPSHRAARLNPVEALRGE
jgi:putative ABC transport system permease protein